MLGGNGVKGQGDLLVGAPAPQAQVQLVKLGQSQLRGLFHPDIRQLSLGKGDGFYFLRVVQAFEDYRIAVFAGDAQAAVRAFKQAPQVPAGNDLLEQGIGGVPVADRRGPGGQQVAQGALHQPDQVPLGRKDAFAAASAAVKHQVTVLPVPQQRAVGPVKGPVRYAHVQASSSTMLTVMSPGAAGAGRSA